MHGSSSLIIRTFHTADAEPLAALLRNSMAAGEQNGHTASDFESLIGAFPIVRNFLVADRDGVPVGMISSDYKLVVVEPNVRRQGIGTALVEALEAALESTPDGPLILYPPHDNAGAVAFLQRLGFAYDHSFWRFGLDSERTIPLLALPKDVTLTGYETEDILPYIELINTSFLDHPTPLRVTLEQVEHVHAKPDFDPGAIAILRLESGQMIGFCTTGIDREPSCPVGHVNLVGVLRAYRGRGLGRWLLLWGIERLRSLGIEQIELSVDAKNENAVGLYRSVGFEPLEEWPQWMRRGDRASG